MKTYQKGLFIAILAVMFLANSVNAATFETDLGFGDKGEEVVAVQQFLKDLGYFDYYETTGNYYGITKRAVADYQLARGISPALGYWGPLTRADANVYFEELSFTQEPTFGAIEVRVASSTPPIATTTEEILRMTGNTTTTPTKTEKAIMRDEEPKISIMTDIVVATTSPQCRADASVVWNNEKYASDPYRDDFVWFNGDKQLQRFAVSKAGLTSVTVSVPGGVVNTKGYDMDYTLLYGVFMDGNLSNTASENFTSMPHTFPISEDYIGKKVAFELFVKYDCVRKGLGTPTMKAETAWEYVNM